MTKIDKEKLCECSKTIEKLRTKCPLIHCITNYVTINDCANAVLAIGGSPSMANETPEMKEFVEIAGTTVINLGTLLEDQIEPMQVAATHTKETGTPLVLDPVAVGVSKLRNDTTIDIINRSSVSVIRGNMSEIKAIGYLYDIIEDNAKAKGVDVADDDIINKMNRNRGKYHFNTIGLFLVVLNIKLRRNTHEKNTCAFTDACHGLFHGAPCRRFRL